MADRTNEPNSLDALFGAEVDWKLGQSDRTTAIALWLLVGTLYVWVLAPTGYLISGFVESLGGDPALRPELASGAGALMAISMLVPGGVMRYFGRSRDGVYGKVTRRLMDAMPHHEVTVRSPITVLPGLRPRLRRKGVLFLVPLRLVIVSRGWRVWAVLTCLALMPVMLVTGGTGVFVVNLFYVVPLIGFFGCRRIVYQEVFYDEIGDVTVKGTTCTIHVKGGPLSPAVECTVEEKEPVQTLADALADALDGRPEIADPGASDAAHAEDLRTLETRNAED